MVLLNRKTRVCTTLRKVTYHIHIVNALSARHWFGEAAHSSAQRRKSVCDRHTFSLPHIQWKSQISESIKMVDDGGEGKSINLMENAFIWNSCICLMGEQPFCSTLKWGESWIWSLAFVFWSTFLSSPHCTSPCRAPEMKNPIYFTHHCLCASSYK